MELILHIRAKLRDWAAEIEKPMFSDQYKGKHLFIDGEFKSIAVEKKGQKPVDGAEYVDATSGERLRVKVYKI